MYWYRLVGHECKTCMELAMTSILIQVVNTQLIHPHIDVEAFWHAELVNPSVGLETGFIVRLIDGAWLIVFF